MNRPPAPTPSAPRPGLLARHRDFRLLWFGETTGQFGSCITGVAMPLIAVTILHASAFQVTLLTAANWLPWLLIGLPVGAWVDRLRRRPVMMTAQAVSLLLVLSIPVAVWTGTLSLGDLLAVALLRGFAQVFFQTSWSAYLPGLLQPADRAEGNAKLQGSASAAQIAGIGAGGLITQLAGAGGGMLVDAATFVVSLLSLGGIHHREPRRDPATEYPALAKGVGQGLRLVAGDPWFRSFTLYGATANLFLTAYQSLVVVFLIRDVGVPDGAVGALVAATSLGGVVGAFAGRRLAARIGEARAMLALGLGLPAFALLVPLTTPGAGLILYIAGGGCVTLGVVGGNVIKAGFQQRYCPPELFGRLSASSAFLNYGAIPVGALLAGVLADRLGLHTALWITTAGVPLAALLLLASPLRRHRDLPGRQLSAYVPTATPATAR